VARSQYTEKWTYEWLQFMVIDEQKERIGFCLGLQSDSNQTPDQLRNRRILLLIYSEVITHY